ncbi:endonuclease I precursor [Pseudoalteromonas sp. SW0106-04]|uniref:endonuclease n=1 Tax=Pseudoalteromonas sp. SW0106-04 TaxID=1702169 RepID=UPI0006C54A7D|nr:endonuclease [Pseudoalteromonas sp. SW0106-04]GAP77002.1 endonuclease I precursor [Pseudoalteromonas sp. SW0106-04]
MKPYILPLLACTLLLTTKSLAHSGRTNSDGCHKDNKSGGYHCHNSTPQPTSTSKLTLPPLPSNYPTSFSNAKSKAERDVYFDQDTTFYCECNFVFDDTQDLDGDGNTHETMIEPSSCGYEPRRPITNSGKPNARVSRIEWEHIMPAHIIGGELDEWKNRKNFPECQENDGSYLSGRECAYELVPLFRRAHDDLVNLVPAVGELNADRSNYQFAVITGENRLYGQCDFEVDFDKDTAEPSHGVRGDIARTYLYMVQRYGANIDSSTLELMKQWNTDDPVSSWECLRNGRIKDSQGYGNPIVTDSCKP